jgi:hypothetical protein
MTTKNPWLQNASLAFGPLQQFADELEFGVKEESQYTCTEDFQYLFIDNMRAADKAATERRKQAQQANIISLEKSPANQFLTTSQQVSHLISLTQSLHAHYEKYNNSTFLKHLEKEIHRKDANAFIYMSPENRTYFYEILNLALKLSDKEYVARLLETQCNVDLYVQNSVEAAKSLLHDLLTLEDLVETVSTLQSDFLNHMK